MADNVPITAGAGTTIATDDIAGVHYQIVKVAHGALDAATIVSSTNPLPVTASSTTPVTIVGVQDTSTTGTITTAASTVGPLEVTQRNVITISIAGTYAGVTFVIEASDDGGTTYYPLQCINNATGQAAATWTPGTNTSASYDSAVGGYTHLRVRSTAWTSGTANVRLTAQSFAYDPVVASISQGLSASGSAVLGNPVLIGGSDGTNARSVKTDTSGRTIVATDPGRTELRYYAVGSAAGTTGTETAITLTKSSGTSATSTAATFVITSGKRFKITSLTFASQGHATATTQTTTFKFRINTAGAVSTTSTPIILSVRTATPATSLAWDRFTVPLPLDGMEIPGDGTLQFGITAAATYTTNAPTWHVVMIGYEY